MNFLFIDTSYYLTIGLLDSNFNWLEYKFIQETKSAQFLHKELHKILEKHDTDPLNLTAIFQAAGPGSYTGIRVGEGITQIIEWHGIKKYSFYHFQVPALLGKKRGKWISNAYKQEIFGYVWENQNGKNFLLPNPKAITEINKHEGEVFTHYKDSLVEDIRRELGVLAETSQLLKDNAVDFFPKIIELDINESPFYYRKDDEEFRPSFY